MSRQKELNASQKAIQQIEYVMDNLVDTNPDAVSSNDDCQNRS